MESFKEFYKKHQKIIYEANSGAAGNADVRKYQTWIESKWKEKINEIFALKLPSNTIVSTLTEYDLWKFQDNKFIYGKDTDEQTFKDKNIISKEDIPIEFRISYRLRIEKSPISELSYCGASTHLPDVNIPNPNDDHIKIMKNPTEYNSFMYKIKSELNVKCPIKVSLSINSNKTIKDLYDDFSLNVPPLSLHEASHLFDYIQNRDKHGRVVKNYNHKRDNYKKYLLDHELSAYTAGAAKEIEIQKLKGEKDFKKALDKSNQWKSMEKMLNVNLQAKNKILGKLIHYWNDIK